VWESEAIVSKSGMGVAHLGIDMKSDRWSARLVSN